MATAELEVEGETKTPETKEAVDWESMTPAQKQAALGKTPDEEEDGEPTVIEDEETETKETPAAGDETPAGDDAAKPKEGEGEGEPEVEAKDWRDDETKEFAAMMGLTDADLSDFGSREELDRALRLIDRKAFEAGKAGLEAPNGQEQKQQQVQQPEVKQPVAQQQQQAGDPLADLSKFKLDETFNEEAAAPINRFVETAATTIKSQAAEIKDLQTRLARFEQSAAEQSVADIERRAIESLHSLGQPELFGKPGERPTKEQAENVKRAVRAHFIHARGLMAAGRQVAPTPAFLKAAVHLEFGDQLLQIQKKQHLAALQKQSARRTGGPAAKPVPPDLDWDDMTPAQRAAAVRKLKKKE